MSAGVERRAEHNIRHLAWYFLSLASWPLHDIAITILLCMGMVVYVYGIQKRGRGECRIPRNRRAIVLQKSAGSTAGGRAQQYKQG